MCMYADAGTMKTAECPIKCYKIVYGHCDDGKVYFQSQCMNFHYELGESHALIDQEALEEFLTPKEKTITLTILKRFEEPVRRTVCKVMLNKGFHSYKNLKDAQDCVVENTPMVLLECEIPKGACYWEGDDTCACEEKKFYCSNALKITGWKFDDDKEWRTSNCMPRCLENRPFLLRLYSIVRNEFNARWKKDKCA